MVNRDKSGVGVLFSVFGIIILIFGALFEFYEKVITQTVVVTTKFNSASFGYLYRSFGDILILAGIALFVIDIYPWQRISRKNDYEKSKNTVDL